MAAIVAADRAFPAAVAELVVGVFAHPMSTGIWSNSIPEPNRSLVPSFSDQTIVEIVYSPSGDRRAIITRDASGGFRVLVEVWAVVDSIDERYRHMACWTLRDNSLTDTLAKAVLTASTLTNNESTDT